MDLTSGRMKAYDLAIPVKALDFLKSTTGEQQRHSIEGET